MKRKLQQMEAVLDSMRDVIADLKIEVDYMEKEKTNHRRSPSQRTRARHNSLSPRRGRRSSPPREYSRNSIYVGKTNNVNKEDLRHQFELSYGENMLEFDIAKHGGHVRVVFSNEEAQLRCLNDATSWKRSFGVDISKHFVSRGGRRN